MIAFRKLNFSFPKLLKLSFSTEAVSPATTTASVDKQLLSSLRKKTGFPFGKCRLALQKFENDFEQAEKWLQDEAVKEGWNKMDKLGTRPMSQGLLATALVKRGPSSFATIVQVNCETDFVARNGSFVNLCIQTADSCIGRLVHQAGLSAVTPQPLVLLAEDLKQLENVHTGKTMGDSVALTVGELGENICLKNAVSMWTTEPQYLLSSFNYSTWDAVIPSEHIQLGKYASLVKLRNTHPASQDHYSPDQLLAANILAKHIVGLNPKQIGDFHQDKASENPDEEQSLVFQTLLKDETKTVGQFLEESHLTVVDFVRIECGAE